MVVRYVWIPSLFFIFLTSSKIKADTWTDPTMTEMINQSDVIGVFRVVAGGPFKAYLVPLKLFKGTVSGKVWLTGYSNKYGPITVLRPGETYFLFINKYENHKSRFHSSSNFGRRFVTRKIYNAYDFVSEKKNGYLVPTPTSGLYRIKHKQIYIDVTQVNYKPEGISLKDFQSMITNSLSGKADDAYDNRLAAQIEKGLNTKNKYLAANYIAMLQYSGNKKFLTVLNNASNNPAWEVRVSLAAALGPIEDPRARDLLVKLVADTSGVVQGEAIRQLAKRESASFLGPILINQLSTASESGEYPSLMDPRRNSRESGLHEIITTLGVLKYTPAIPELLRMLDACDDYSFIQIVNCLIDLGSTDYIESFCKRLSKVNISQYHLNWFMWIVENQNLDDCTPALITYLENANKTDNEDESTMLSTLAKMAAKSQDTSIVNFIIADFNKFLNYYDTLRSSVQHQWLKTYISACATLQVSESRDVVYHALYEWSGYDVRSFDSEMAFDRKRKNEDSVRSVFHSVLGSKGYHLDDVIYFLPMEDRLPSFIIKVDVPTLNKSAEERKMVADALKIPEHDVFIVSKSGTCWLDCQYRFDRKYYSLIRTLIDYAKSLPHKQDLQFLKALQDARAEEAEYFREEISEAIKSIEQSF